MRKVSLLLFLVPVLAGAQAKYVVTYDGKAVGSASVLQKAAEKGGKSVQMTIEMRGAGNADSHIRMESVFDATGAPVRKFMEASSGGKRLKTTIVTFDKAGAHVVIDEGGKRTTKDVGLVDTAPRANAAEFWFFRDKPKKGAELRCYLFDMDTLSWQLTTTVYRGPDKVGKFSGHNVSTERYASLVDDTGLPVLIDLGKTRLERIQP